MISSLVPEIKRAGLSYQPSVDIPHPTQARHEAFTVRHIWTPCVLSRQRLLRLRYVIHFPLPIEVNLNETSRNGMNTCTGFLHSHVSTTGFLHSPRGRLVLTATSAAGRCGAGSKPIRAISSPSRAGIVCAGGGSPLDLLAAVDGSAPTAAGSECWTVLAVVVVCSCRLKWRRLPTNSRNALVWMGCCMCVSGSGETHSRSDNQSRIVSVDRKKDE